MIEPYVLFKFLHVAAAIVWLGGAGALAVVVTLGAGLAAAGRAGSGFGAPWLAWGFVGVAGSLLLTALPIRRAAAALGHLAASAGPGDPRLGAARRRLTALNAANLLLLRSVVWAMVGKPTLGPPPRRW